jgi:WD40 repeat protein
VYSGTMGGRINIGEIATGRESASWQAHEEGAVLALAISPDGRLLASGGSDHSIRLWDPATHRELAYWEVDDSSVTALSFSPDGQSLVSGGEDGILGDEVNLDAAGIGEAVLAQVRKVG